MDASTPPTSADLLRKMSSVADLAAGLRRMEVRESVRRGDLVRALSDTLVERAHLMAALREQLLARHVAASAAGVRPRRWPAIPPAAARVLSRLKWPGQALTLAVSGRWRPSGRPIFDLRHMAAYVRRGPDPTVSPPALFDQAWYLAGNPDVAASGLSPLVHYVVAGAAEDRAPHPLFDPAFYRRRYGRDLDATGLGPLDHYVRIGAAHGYDPHPLFDSAYYLSQCPDQASVGGNLLLHYLETGWAHDYSPHPLFRARWYRGRLPRTEAAAPPLVHYLSVGWLRGLKPHPLVDPAWYWAENPDVAASGLEPLGHFLSAGAAEGRSPSPWFDLPHYVKVRGADLPAEVNPLVDYQEVGAWTLGELRPGFPASAYLAARSGLIREGLTPLEHWAMQASA